LISRWKLLAPHYFYPTYPTFVIPGLEDLDLQSKSYSFLIGDLLSTKQRSTKIPDESMLMFFFEKQSIASSGMTIELTTLQNLSGTTMDAIK